MVFSFTLIVYLINLMHMHVSSYGLLCKEPSTLVEVTIILMIV
jgi:hypothetical protein